MNQASFSFYPNQLFSVLFLSGGHQYINDDRIFSEEVHQEPAENRRGLQNHPTIQTISTDELPKNNTD
jgi:hypothetical protein